MNILVVFLTGLTTGGLSCLAVQGGLLASVIANEQGTIKKGKEIYPILFFLLAKLLIHTAFGFLLGWLGSTISLSLGVRLTFQFFTGLFMFATALNLLQVHPIFRYVTLQPPKFLQRFIRKTSKSTIAFGPFLLGLLTIFIPCGVTQAMEVLAISSGSPIQGALLLFAFVLGTFPIFSVIGFATAKFSEVWHHRFSRIAAYILIFMAVISINGVLLVIDSPITIQKITSPIVYFFSEERFKAINAARVVNGLQQVTITITNDGYTPKKITVKAGIPVQLTLQSNNVYTCALSFVLKEFGIKTFLKSTDTQTFTFTPQRKGSFTFACSMGMYSGVMEVI